MEGSDKACKHPCLLQKHQIGVPTSKLVSFRCAILSLFLLIRTGFSLGFGPPKTPKIARNCLKIVKEVCTPLSISRVHVDVDYGSRPKAQGQECKRETASIALS